MTERRQGIEANHQAPTPERAATPERTPLQQIYGKLPEAQELIDLNTEQTDKRVVVADIIDDLMIKCGVGAFRSASLHQAELETADQILSLFDI